MSRGYEELDQIYQVYDAYINDGINIINESIVKYSNYFDPDDISGIEEVLRDEFLRRNYLLSGRKNYFDLGFLDEKNGDVVGDSPWLTAGLHWFNALYLKGKERQPDYGKLFSFLNKVEKAVRSLSKNAGDKSFQPCGA